MYPKKLILPLFLLINLNIPAQSLPGFVPTDGLVGWWPFTGNAADSSNNGNNGNVFNATLTTDRFGNANAAYSFNGIDSRIEVPDAVSLRCRKITMSVWIFNNNIVKTSQVIYKGSINADGEAYSVYCTNNYLGSGVKISSNCVPATGWKGVDCKQQAQQGSWDHLLATYDGAIFKLYKNGALDTSLAFPGLIDSCVGGGLRFGYNHTRFFASTGDPFDGIIDDIGIWNRVLEPFEINKMYASGASACGNGNTGINICNPQRSLHVNDVLRLEPRSFSPPGPSKGDMYFDGTMNKLRVYDGTSWKDCW